MANSCLISFQNPVELSFGIVSLLYKIENHYRHIVYYIGNVIYSLYLFPFNKLDDGERQER